MRGAPFAGAMAFALACLLADGSQAEMGPPALSLPVAATETGRLDEDFARIRLPVNRWRETGTPMIELQGQVSQVAWRIPEAAGTTTELTDRLAAGLAGAGFAPVFACATDDCGGFDFRYEAPVLPEPQMHVDLGDFQYRLLVRGQGDGADYAVLVVSRTGATAFVQLLSVRQGKASTLPPEDEAHAPAPPSADAGIQNPPPAAAGASDATGGIAPRLDADGHAVLADLDFAPGSAELAPARYGSLTALAAYLADHPDRQVIIVGHTDSSGNEASNLALSRARAQTVRQILTKDYGVAAAQITADGIGSLAPLTTNLSEEGRRTNRRVEAVLASTR